MGGHGAAMEHAEVHRDETLQHPRTVFQVLKRHYARYTPEMVQATCGVPPETFLKVCEAVTANSGRDRTTSWVYSVGWTHHSVGVQYIRGSAIIQLLLGNMGRPGGGILALRGHASIQGSTDIPTLFNLLPGYLPMPKAGEHDTLRDYIDSMVSPDMKGFWRPADAYAVSLLKSYWGDAATADNDFAFDYLPRLTGDHGTYQTVMDMLDDKVEGYLVFGQNPAVGSAHGRMQRLGMAHLKWLVVRDLALIETATFWKDGPEIETGELRTEDIGTEVFFFPAASHVEKDGSFTQTQRVLQWHHKAVEPPGDARSELQLLLPPRPQDPRAAGRLDPRARPAVARPGLGLPRRRDRRPVRRGGPEGDQRGPPHRRQGRPAAVELHRDADRRLDHRRLLDLHRRLHRRRQPGRPAPARPGAVLGRPRVGLGVADEPPHALQPRLGRPRGQAVERAQGLRLVGRGAGRVDRARRPRLRGRQGPVVPAAGGDRRTGGPGRRRPVHHAGRRQGVALRTHGAARRPAARRTTSRTSRR